MGTLSPGLNARSVGGQQSVNDNPLHCQPLILILEAPVVSWKEKETSKNTTDPWSRTYVTKDQQPTPPTPPDSLPVPPNNPMVIPNPPNAKLPHPISSLIGSTSQTPFMNSRVSAHIASTAARLGRIPSPTKSYHSLVAPESDILPSIHANDTSLSKVYGSVLQPKETLTTHSCAICNTPFHPDSTIYPDPSVPPPPMTRFLCRPCYINNGGLKGTCPTCARPVLTLKTEGGFIHAADQYWHKQCFNCEGCYKNIGSSPMVDLLGRPCCSDCFDDCLKQDRSPAAKQLSKNSSVDIQSSVGGTQLQNPDKMPIRESSPTIEELEMRLGIKTRELSPEMGNISRQLRDVNLATESRRPNKVGITSSRLRGKSPLAGERFTGSLRIQDEGANQKISSAKSFEGPSTQNVNSTPVSRYRTYSTYGPSKNQQTDTVLQKPESQPRVLSQPNLISDTSLSKFPSLDLNSPPSKGFHPGVILPSSLHASVFGQKQQRRVDDKTQPVKPSAKSWAGPNVASSCAACGHSLFNLKDGGCYVTISGEHNGDFPQTYHNNCFRCVTCNQIFQEGPGRQAAYIKTDNGPCHPSVSYATPESLASDLTIFSSAFNQQERPSSRPQVPFQPNSIMFSLKQLLQYQGSHFRGLAREPHAQDAKIQYRQWKSVLLLVRRALGGTLRALFVGEGKGTATTVVHQVAERNWIAARRSMEAVVSGVVNAWYTFNYFLRQ